jgi:hypothetical protein
VGDGGICIECGEKATEKKKLERQKTVVVKSKL